MGAMVWASAVCGLEGPTVKRSIASRISSTTMVSSFEFLNRGCDGPRAPFPAAGPRQFRPFFDIVARLASAAAQIGVKKIREFCCDGCLWNLAE